MSATAVALLVGMMAAAMITGIVSFPRRRDENTLGSFSSMWMVKRHHYDVRDHQMWRIDENGKNNQI